MKRFHLLEPLRGLAALWVLLFHYGFTAASYEAAPVPLNIAKHGHLGVPMFFVISGICIAATAKSSLDRGRSTREFVNRRLRRIFPPYWFSICVVAALPFVMEFLSSLKTGIYLPPDGANPNLAFINYSALDWLSVASLARVFQTEPAVTSLQLKFTSINAPYWTLALEVQFYLAVAVALWAKKGFYPTLIGITLLGVACRFVPGAFVSGWFLPYWPMFALGVLLFAMFERGIEPAALWGSGAPFIAVVVLGVALAIVAVVLTRSEKIDQASLPAACIFALLLFFGKGLDPWFGRWFESNHYVARYLAWPILGLGAMSYSVYLLHGRLQYFVMQLVRQIISTDTVLYDLAVVAGMLALCVPFYWFCEMPFILASTAKSRVSSPDAVSTRPPPIVTS